MPCSSSARLRLALCALALAGGAQEPKRGKAPAAAKSYVLVFADEFAGNGPVSEEDWVYEEGFVRNEELQYYKRDNVRRENGVLILEARREECANAAFSASAKDWRKQRPSASYTSGSIKTRGKHEWLYGRFGARFEPDDVLGQRRVCTGYDDQLIRCANHANGPEVRRRALRVLSRQGPVGSAAVGQWSGRRSAGKRCRAALPLPRCGGSRGRCVCPRRLGSG